MLRTVRHAAAWAALVLSVSAGAQAGATAAKAFDSRPVAMLECEIPALERFVVHGSVPLPRGFTFDRNACPFVVRDPAGNPLPTQWEAIALRADGSLMTVEILAAASRGSLQVGSRQRFGVHREAIIAVATPLTSSQSMGLSLRTVDVHGNEYIGDLNFVRVHRLGPVRLTAEWTTRILPSQPNASTLEQLGAAQVWISRSPTTEVIEIAVNFHNGSSQHPAWHLYFEKLELLMPAGWNAISMWPEVQGGRVTASAEGNVLALIEEIPDGSLHFLEQRHERGFRYFAYPPGVASQGAAELAARKGWAVAIDTLRDPQSGERTWSHFNPSTPGYFPQALAMPSLGHIDQLSARLSADKSSLFTEVSSPVSVGPGNAVLLADGYRNPFSGPYGGMAGGHNLHPYEGMEALYTGQQDGLVNAYTVMRCYNDRQPGAMYEDDGESFHADDPAYLNTNGTQPYLLFNNTFLVTYPNITHDRPWLWHQQDASHEAAVEAANRVPRYRDPLLSYDPIDSQHFWRYSRNIKMLVYLDNDPLARRRMQAACELIRATYYDGPGGRLRAFLDGPARIGAVFGREHAATGDLAAAGYATGDEAWRRRWKPWFETYVDALSHLQTPGGFWQAHTTGKTATNPPFGDGFVAFFRVIRPNEHIFTTHTLRGIKEAVFGEGADPERHARSHQMLFEAGRATWFLMWRWKSDLSGPDGTGTWDRVAVGEIGDNPTMFVDHNDHPNEQYATSGVNLDAYLTGLGLTYGLAELDVTPALVTVLRTYLESPDFLEALEAQQLDNLANNAALLAIVQSGVF